MLERFSSQSGHISALVAALAVPHGWRSVLMQIEQLIVVNHDEKVRQQFHFVTRFDTE